MSIVNKASKNNVLYNLEDSRLYILDLGDVTSLVDTDAFQTTTPLASLQALINAEEGNVKFTIEGVDAVCKKIYGASYIDGSTTSYRAFATFFMQGEENAYTTYTIQISGTSESQTAQVSGFLINQTIPQGGGSGGDSVPVVAYSGLQWQDDGDAKYVEFEPTEEDYTTLTTNDVAMIKATDEDNETLYLLNTAIQQEGGSNMYLFGCFNPESMAMAMVARADDGEGGYIYSGTIYKAKMPTGDTTLYVHEVQMTDNSDTYRLKFISEESNEIETYNNLENILSAYTRTFGIIYVDEKSDCYDIASVGYTSGSQATTLNYISSGSISSVSLSTFENMTISDNVHTL